MINKFLIFYITKFCSVFKILLGDYIGAAYSYPKIFNDDYKKLISILNKDQSNIYKYDYSKIMENI